MFFLFQTTLYTHAVMPEWGLKTPSLSPVYFTRTQERMGVGFYVEHFKIEASAFRMFWDLLREKIKLKDCIILIIYAMSFTNSLTRAKRICMWSNTSVPVNQSLKEKFFFLLCYEKAPTVSSGFGVGTKQSGPWFLCTQDPLLLVLHAVVK